MKKKLIFNLIILAAVAVAVFIFILPLWDSVKTAKKTIENGKSELEAINNLLAKTKVIKEDYEQVKSQAEKVFISLPKEKDLPDLMIQFESLAAIHNLILESISFGDFKENGSRAKSGQAVSFAEDDMGGQPLQLATDQTSVSSQIVFRNLPVSLMVAGSYINLKKYITGLEANIRSMNIQSINLGGVSGESSSNKDNFTFDLELLVYFQ